MLWWAKRDFTPRKLGNLQLWLDATQINAQGYSLDTTLGNVNLGVQSVGGVDLFADSDTFSVETYVRFTGTANGVVLSKSAAAQNLRTFEFFRFANDFYTTIRGATTLVRAAANITNDVWYHIALTWDGATAKFYWNGSEVATPSVGSAAIENVNIGFGVRNVASPSAGFSGLLSDVRIWNTARTAQQIANNYQRRLNGNESGLVGYWKLDRGTGTTVADSTSNNNTGTISGATWNNSEPLTEPIDDNTAVRVWQDQSGNSYNAEQSTTAARPTYRTNQLNGLPAVVFDGTDDRLSLVSGALGMLRNVAGATVFAVVRYPATSSQQLSLSITNNTDFSRLGLSQSSTKKYRASGRRLDADNLQEAVSTPDITSVFVIHSALANYQNTLLQNFVNGRLDGQKTDFQTAGNTSDTNSFGIYIGSLNSSFSLLNGAIAEIIVYNRALTSRELSEVHAYLSKKWGIQLA